MNVPALLEWYRRVRRPLPWRVAVTPYRTLVSELMLQQTRVDTVIPYFLRFMEVFPTVEDLAAAPLERVLECWSGLGYYSRARNLHSSAVRVVEEGGFPTTILGWMDLPGVGRYTAGAVGSIALGIDAPVVDGNVERVLCRQHALADDPKRIGARLWELAAATLPRGEAGDYNQALMELGATVCLPVRPLCQTCPVRQSCLGIDDPSLYPKPKVKAVVPEMQATTVLVWESEHVVLARRESRGLLGGLWEPPLGVGLDVEATLARVGLRPHGCEPIGVVRHVFSHLRLRTTVYAGAASGTLVAADYADVRRVARDALPGMALSTLARKLLRAERGA